MIKLIKRLFGMICANVITFFRHSSGIFFVNVSQTRWKYLQKNVADLQKSIIFA